MQISNDKRLITSTRILYKNSNSSLDCIIISELCSAINSTVATLMKTSLHSIKLKHSIWQDTTCVNHCMKQMENMKT